MKPKSPILLFFIIFLFVGFTQSVYFRVKSVYDGDTIGLEDGQRIRYLGVDAPEIGYDGKKSEYKALSAKSFNLNLVKGRNIKLEFDLVKRDRYGRLLAYVYLEDGRMVNPLLVKMGLAHVMVTRDNMEHFSLLLLKQREALMEKRGIWSKKIKKGEAFYMGNRKSLRFHRPDCSFGKKIHPNNRVRFSGLRDAYWEGFSPCKRCNP